MAYDLEEQEELDALKAWWRANGNKVLAFLTVVFACFAAVQGWKYYQNKKSIEASNEYQQLIQTDSKDLKAIQGISGQLIDKYPSTPYAGRAALIAAKANYKAKDAKSAKAQLEWAIKNAKEEQIEAIARLQLAAIQYDEKNYDAALQTLSAKHAEGFDGLFADLKGDVLAAQGKKDEARTAYKEALAKLDAQGKYRHYTEFKLEALGS
ncbi:MAG TPA: tetratricopeptide repeat protein [Methylophilaceae bacterium]|nr:tetratricopeptide repeat protein [Methylophilaceae bacterium]